ncbi:MAG: nidogen-like domain-containing protein [Bacteroidota bacterium]
MRKLSRSVPYLLVWLSILTPISIWGQAQDSEQFPSPGKYWIEVGEDLQGLPVAYRQFNRSSKCDDCSELLALPFRFYFYGQEYDELYLNANGNVSFGAALSEYTPSDFCLEGPQMIAPFYSDVDIYQCGQINYYIDQHSVIITWTRVCHYLAEDDPTGLKNTFQLILTDGHYSHIRDIALPQRASVIFNYQDMQWTTGHSSGGLGGFGGQAATVGVNQGDGQKCFAYGSFDHEGSELENGIVGGVSHLDYRYIAWNGREGLLASQSLASPFATEKQGSSLLFQARVFPNPTTSLLSLEIQLSIETEIYVQLTDMSGRKVFGKKRLVPSRATAMQIPTEHLAKGLYYLSVQYQDQIWNRQIAKV